MALKHILAGSVGVLLLRLLRLTWRVDEQPRRHVQRARARVPPGTVYVMWHSRILIGVATQSGQGLHVMISQHGDGELIARAASRMGYHPIRGSTTRGGSAALYEAARVVREGADAALTPDGPRGPRMQVQKGCVLAAMLAGATIVPVAFEARRARRLRSWDRFVVPYPFTRIAIRFGAPIEVPAAIRDSDLARWCDRVRDGLVEVTRSAAAALGTEAESPDVDPLEERFR